MPRNPAALLCATAAALMLGGTPGLAGKTSVDGIGGLPVFVPDLPQTPPAVAAVGGGAGALGTPASVSERLELAVKFCARLPEKAYLVDCLAEQLDAVSRLMPATGNLAEARAQIAQASRELAQLARANADRARPRVTARVRAGNATRRALIPVLPARQASVNAQAADVLERTETILLRSAGRPASLEGYRAIAGAVASGKVLLRSA